MSVLVTGAHGFIGKNLIVRLSELNIKTETYTRNNLLQDLEELVKDADCIVHLAGENRPKDKKGFDIVNTGLTESLCNILRRLGKSIPIILSSSTQAEFDNEYGRSKLNAEIAVRELEMHTGCSAYVYRLPGVFGKWCKPNYNSVVATFCYNISHDLPIQINNPSFELSLVYIDDVIEEFVKVIQGVKRDTSKLLVLPEYKIKLGDLAGQIKMFKKSRDSLITERVGGGLIGRLYSTYLSYISPEQFVYSVPSYCDERGIFAEILKTKDSGQFSYFTIT